MERYKFIGFKLNVNHCDALLLFAYFFQISNLFSKSLPVDWMTMTVMQILNWGHLTNEFIITASSLKSIEITWFLYFNWEESNFFYQVAKNRNYRNEMNTSVFYYSHYKNGSTLISFNETVVVFERNNLQAVWWHLTSCCAAQCCVLVASETETINLKDDINTSYSAMRRKFSGFYLQYETEPLNAIRVKMWLLILNCRFPFPLLINVIVLPVASTYGRSSFAGKCLRENWTSNSCYNVVVE